MMDAIAQLNTSLVDRYEIEREIGAGGMATVYLARDLRHHRPVALKVLNPELGAVLGVERFLAEIRVTANLQHPNLLPLFDSGEAGGLLFYVMPYVEGESLRARLTREKQLGVDEAVHIAVAVAGALEYAHAHGVVHRDLKPENILLQAGEPVVADFGIALAVSNAGGGRITQTGLSLGTPQYMSPEQATGDRVIDGRADIYSLAAVLYEMLVGDPPHAASTVQAIIAKVLTERPQSVRVARAAVPESVASAIDRALEKLPADRFARASDFAAALQGRHAALPTTATRAAAQPGTARRWSMAVAPWIMTAAAMVLAGAEMVVRRAPPAEATISALVPPAGEEYADQESFGALSPDGRRFAFIGQTVAGESHLWVRALDSTDAVRIPGTDGARAPFWSSDGGSIYFFLKDLLMSVRRDGGGATTVCKAPNATSGSASTDGTILFADERGIEQLTRGASDCRVVIPQPPNEATLRHPTALPGGRLVLFSTRDSVDGIGVGDVRSGRFHPVTSRMRDPTAVGSDLVLMGHIEVEGSSQLVAQRFDRGTQRFEGDMIPVSGPVRTAGSVFSYAATANTLVYFGSRGDEKKLIVSRAGEVLDSALAHGTWTHAFARTHPWLALGARGGIWIYDFARRTRRALATIDQNGLAEFPVWSPGDSLVAYDAGAASVHCALHVHRLRDDSDSTIAGTSPRCFLPADWSADGRYLLLSEGPLGRYVDRTLFALDRTTGRLDALPHFPKVDDARFSPDGRWIAYVSGETGTMQVSIRPFMRDGEAIPVSTDAGRSPRWRADGRELFYQLPDGRVVSSAVTSSGNDLRVDPPKTLFKADGWSRQLFTDGGQSFDASPDGQRFALRVTPNVPAAVLVQNWRAKLER